MGPVRRSTKNLSITWVRISPEKGSVQNLWQGGLEIFRGKPIFGHGPGYFLACSQRGLGIFLISEGGPDFFCITLDKKTQNPLFVCFRGFMIPYIMCFMISMMFFGPNHHGEGGPSNFQGPGGE